MDLYHKEWEEEKQHSFREWCRRNLIVICICEVLFSAIPAVATALYIIPVLKRERGGMAFGSEWIFFVVVFLLVYGVARKIVDSRIFGEDE